jgi:hypothetical protein
MANKKIIILTVIGLAMIAAAGYFIFLKFWNQPIEPKISQILIEDQYIKDNSAPFEIDITYPQISGQEGYNSLVKNLVDSKLAEFKQISMENDAAVKEIDPKSYAEYPRSYYFSIGYDKGQADSDLISTVFTISSFTGGAHPSTYSVAINYDFENQKEISLSDIYSGQENYLQTISDYCIAELTKHIANAGQEYTDKDWINTGAGPVEENFAIFLINKDSITFYFPQYQVAPYAYGDFKVVMAR